MGLTTPHPSNKDEFDAKWAKEIAAAQAALTKNKKAIETSRPSKEDRDFESSDEDLSSLDTLEDQGKKRQRIFKETTNLGNYEDDEDSMPNLAEDDDYSQDLVDRAESRNKRD